MIDIANNKRANTDLQFKDICNCSGITAQKLEGLKQWGCLDSMLECPFNISGAVPNTKRVVGKRNCSLE